VDPSARRAEARVDPFGHFLDEARNPARKRFFPLVKMNVEPRRGQRAEMQTWIVAARPDEGIDSGSGTRLRLRGRASDGSYDGDDGSSEASAR
jgi:hypothetical protein